MAVENRNHIVFVSIDGDRPERNGIDVFARTNSQLQFIRFIPMRSTLFGLALSQDGRTLFIANDGGVAVLRADLAAQGDIVLRYLAISDNPGTIEVAVSPDARFIYFSNESMKSVGVVGFNWDAATGREAQWHVIGAIATNLAPVGLTLSSDGRWLYATSEIKPSIIRPCPGNGVPRAQGTLQVIDTQQAQSASTKAVVSSVTAGCSPVRVALSPDDTTVWVTARGDNRILAFDAQALRTNASRAQRASVDVGSAPVGLALIDDGKVGIVANSNRFNQSAGRATATAFDTTKALEGQPAVLTTLQTGAFPREVTESPDHQVIYITNYGSDSFQVIQEQALLP